MRHRGKKTKERQSLGVWIAPHNLKNSKCVTLDQGEMRGGIGYGEVRRARGRRREIRRALVWGGVGRYGELGGGAGRYGELGGGIGSYCELGGERGIGPPNLARNVSPYTTTDVSPYKYYRRVSVHDDGHVPVLP